MTQRAIRHGDRGDGAPTMLLALLALIFTGAMFGFFFAWTCSTMWGLDAADPNIAIAAMQAMNASVRNWVFAPAFFFTPVSLALATLAVWRSGKRQAAACLAAACLIYVLGAMVPTMTVNVPMNEALAAVETPLDLAEAQTAWRTYSAPWQAWNTFRTVLAGLALALTGIGLMRTGTAPTERNLQSNQHHART